MSQMNKMNSVKDRIFRSKYFGIIAIGAAIVSAAVIILGGRDSPPKDYSSKDFNEFEYTEALENKIEKTVEKISGAGRTKAMIKIQNSYETLYASDGTSNEQQSDKNGETNENVSSVQKSESYVILQSEEGEGGLEITEFSPAISGVLIVCEGGNDEYIKQQIKEAVATVLNIPEQKVCVLESKR